MTEKSGRRRRRLGTTGLFGADLDGSDGATEKSRAQPTPNGNHGLIWEPTSTWVTGRRKKAGADNAGWAPRAYWEPTSTG